MQVLNLCGRAVLKIIVGVLGISLVVYAWYKFPNAIVSMLDFNLAAIKAGCKLVPAPYGAHAGREGLSSRFALGFPEHEEEPKARGHTPLGLNDLNSS